MVLSRTRLKRELRHNSTPAEKLFWSVVCARKLLGLKFRRQHNVGPFIVDFCCPEESLILEIDGDSHFTYEGIKADKIRTAFIESQGYKIIRYDNLQVLDNIDGVIQDLITKLTAL